MIIAIDEVGDFQEGSENLHFFVAAHVRTLGKNRRDKARQFCKWESQIPSRAKNSKGEIKGNALTERQIEDFLKSVLTNEPYIGISPIGFIPRDNPSDVFQKHKNYVVKSIRNGFEALRNLGNEGKANFADQLGNWVNALNYQNFCKLWLLGNCVYTALRYSIGHAITGDFEQELRNISYQIDRDFIKEPNPTSFWKDLLRCLLYQASISEPIPVLDTWGQDHWFYKKYGSNGKMNFNAIFWENCNFVLSHESWEVRIADITGTIFHRIYNRNEYRRLFPLLDACCWGNRTATILKLNDFGPEDEEAFVLPNPWLEDYLNGVAPNHE